LSLTRRAAASSAASCVCAMKRASPFYVLMR